MPDGTARVGRWELIGTTSGPGDTDAICANGPGLYTSLLTHADWIRATINGPSLDRSPSD
ncbi:hypothetical protein ACWGE0_03785 [Lentzea sp. NPDC054927]